MSRIHDALKKAEQERAGAGWVGAPEPDPEAMSASVAGVLTEPQRAPSVQEEDLQFSYIAEHCANPLWHTDPQTDIFSDSELNVGVAEQFRTLRSRLYQMRNAGPLRTLLITSSLPAEGKTFLTANLGSAIVRQFERRTLLIDADLRRSQLHLRLGAPLSPGLTEYLRGDAELLSVIQRGRDGNMFLIPGGNAVENPSELLANGRFKILLDRVASAFDWILIDSAPCVPVADASILAESCDGVLLVVKAGETPAAVVEKAGRELQGRNVVGVVMNHVEERSLGYDSYYSSSYQGRKRGGSKD